MSYDPNNNYSSGDGTQQPPADNGNSYNTMPQPNQGDFYNPAPTSLPDYGQGQNFFSGGYGGYDNSAANRKMPLDNPMSLNQMQGQGQGSYQQPSTSYGQPYQTNLQQQQQPSRSPQMQQQQQGDPNAYWKQLMQPSGGGGSGGQPFGGMPQQQQPPRFGQQQPQNPSSPQWYGQADTGNYLGNTGLQQIHQQLRTPLGGGDIRPMFQKLMEDPNVPHPGWAQGAAGPQGTPGFVQHPQSQEDWVNRYNFFAQNPEMLMPDWKPVNQSTDPNSIAELQRIAGGQEQYRYMNAQNAQRQLDLWRQMGAIPGSPRPAALPPPGMRNAALPRVTGGYGGGGIVPPITATGEQYARYVNPKGQIFDDGLGGYNNLPGYVEGQGRALPGPRSMVGPADRIDEQSTVRRGNGNSGYSPTPSHRADEENTNGSYSPLSTMDYLTQPTQTYQQDTRSHMAEESNSNAPYPWYTPAVVQPTQAYQQVTGAQHAADEMNSNGNYVGQGDGLYIDENGYPISPYAKRKK